MKKRIMFTACSLLICSAHVWAYDAQIDGFYYKFSGNEATIVNPSNSKEDWDITDYSGDIIIPSTVSYQGKNYTVTIIGEGAFYMSQNLTNIVIPNTVTAIEGHAFESSSNLVSVVVPNSVVTIKDDAFAFCSSLKNISIPETIEYIEDPFRQTPLAEFLDNQPVDLSGVQYIGLCAYKFKGEIPLDSTVVLKEGTTGVSSSAFANCRWLKHIEMPYTVKHIGGAAFRSSGLTEVNISNSDAIIDSYAFAECNNLVKAKLNVKAITSYAFWFCGSMEEIHLSASLRSIGERAFFSPFPKIAYIYMESTVPPYLHSDAFYQYANPKPTLYVPSGSKEKYEAANWNYYTSIVEMEDDTDISQMEDVIYTEPTSGFAGTTVDLCVKMKNVLTPVGCSFKLTLPEGVRLQTDADGDVVYELGSRAKKMSLTMQDWGDGSYDFALTPSSATATITGNDDTFVTFHVVLPDDMEAGDYKLKLTRCLIQSKTDGTTKDYILSDVVSTLTVEDYMMGDVNGDRTITPSDAIMTLYHYFSVEQTGFNAKAADVNGDSTVTPADAIEMLYMYFGAGSNAARQNKQTHEPQ